MKLSKYNTCELVEELSKRTGVEKTVVEPHKCKEINADGPAIVLVVID